MVDSNPRMKNKKTLQKLKNFIFTDSSIQKIEREGELLKMKIENYCDDLYSLIFIGVTEFYENEPIYITDIKVKEFERNLLLEFYDDDGVCCRFIFEDLNIIEHVGNGKFIRDDTNRLNFELSEINVNRYKDICEKIISNFEAKKVNNAVNGLDEVLQDFLINGKMISIEWDNWSGLTVIAKEKNAESIVREIGRFLANE